MTDGSLRTTAEPTPDPDPDRDGLTIKSLEVLLKAVTDAQIAGNVVVVAAYILPVNCDIGRPSDPPVAGGPQPINLSGVPPGHKSALYLFPMVAETYFERPDVPKLITERFRKSSEMQAIIATSNHLYIKELNTYIHSHPGGSL